MMTWTVCFEEKLLFVMQNLGIWAIMGTGSKYVVESAIFGIADPDLPIHYATFIGLQWWLRVVYSWVLPLLSIFGRRWSGSRCPLLPAAGSQCTAVKLPIINILSIWSVSITCVTWLVYFELLVGVTWAPAVPGTKYCPPLGMPGTQTVGVTHNCSWGDIPPSSLVIRALHIQYTRLTRSMQQCKTMWLPFRVRIIAIMVGLGSGWGGTRRTLPPSGCGHAIFVLVCFPGRAEEWVRWGGKWKAIVWCCVKSGIPVPKTIKIWQPATVKNVGGNFFDSWCNCTIIEPWIRIGYG